MDKDFQIFLKSYMNKEFDELVDSLEKELINVNVNLLYAYHQWLKNNGKIQ